MHRYSNSFARRGGRSTLLLALSLLFAQASFARAEEPVTIKEFSQFNDIASTGGNVTFLTKNRNLTGLSAEFARIYLSLYNSQRLSVKRVSALSARTIDQVFRDQRLFYGKVFPIEIDSMACDLNAHVCTRVRDASKSQQVDSLTQQVTGYAPSPGHWSLRPDAVLILPDVDIEPDIEWSSLNKPADHSIESIVIDDLGGCESFDETCKKLIAFYNPSLGERAFDSKYEGPITLPVLRVALKTNAASAGELLASISPNDSKDKPALQLITEERPGGSLTLLSVASGANSYKIYLQGLRPNLARTPDVTGINKATKGLSFSIGTLKLKGFVSGGAPSSEILPGQLLRPQDFNKYRADLMDEINFPLHSLPYGDEYQAPIGVGVFDSRVTAGHCALSRDTVKVTNINAASDGGAPAQCNRKTEAHEDVDHGTHVVGIIAARYINPSTGEIIPVGLNPYASVFAYETDYSGVPGVDFGRNLKKFVQSHLLRVVNMSFGYLLSAQNPDTKIIDPLEDPILGLRDSTLFVVAAGNAGADKSYICDIRPACFDMLNVISVAAIDRDLTSPSLLDSDGQANSNYGSRVHIAAIGKDVFSTLANGAFGELSGTSMAAPQVTAVASLLLAKFTWLRPIEIKNRLIYCSDRLRTLKTKLFGGRLNADCTLDAETGRLQLRTTPNVIQHGKVLPADIVFLETDGSDLKISIQNIRSLALDDPRTPTYTVFFNVRHDGQLARLTDLSFKDPHQIVRFMPDATGGDSIDVEVGQLLRYVSPIR